MSKTLITIPGTWNSPHSKNWMECEFTWVPKLRKMGFDVIYLMSNPHLDKDYELLGNFFFSKCLDGKEHLYYKNHYFVSQYILNETNYDYVFKIDSDTFVHPYRFISLLQEHTIHSPKNYMGCVIPYPGLNTHSLNKYYIEEEKYYASGAGYLLSRKVLQFLIDDFNPSENPSALYDDLIVGDILYQRKLNLFHDSRILFESPYKRTISDPHNIGTPFIGEVDSFLALQHYCDGHMKEIMDKLQLW